MTKELTIDEHHRLQGPGVEHFTSPNVTEGRRGAIKPEIGVIHYTGGPDIGPAHNTFMNPRGGVSAHLMINRDGSIRQYVPFSRRAWHAGKSSWKGRANLNNWSIGVEFVNSGRLIDENGKFFARGRRKLEISPKHVQMVDGRPYHKYSRNQFLSGQAVMRALWSRYGIDEWVGHSDVAPHRKVDPGPLMNCDDMWERSLTIEVDTLDDLANRPFPVFTARKPLYIMPDWLRAVLSIFDPKETR